MNRFFDYNNPFVQFMNRVADLIILNFLFILCSLPIITAGASFTALHYVCLKMVRDEEGYITKSFFRSFRENFRQATIMWLIFLIGGLLVGTDILMVRSGQAFPPLLRYFIYFDAVILLAVSLYAFPLQARFENTVLRTLRNAMLLTVGAFPRTVAMLVIMAMPLLIMLQFLQLLPVLVMVGFSAPAYACAALYSPVFLRMEPPEEEAPSDDTWTVPEEPAETSGED